MAGVVVTLCAVQLAAAAAAPDGSYLRSCRYAEVKPGSVLVAQCRTPAGRWNDTSLAFRRCGAADIANRNGTLACASGGGGEGGGGNQGVPPGSYQTSCRNIAPAGPGILRADCRTPDGRWKATAIDYGRCNGDIFNNGGALACGGNGGGGNGGGRMPPGGWQQTCRNPSLYGPVLSAQCFNNNNRIRETKLDLRHCPRGPVSNNNGYLVCSKADVYVHQITLYRDENYRGTSKTIGGPVKDVRNVGFDKTASSLRIDGSPRAWQLCNQPNFRGRCVVIGQDTPDLRIVDMSDKVASIRPVN